MRGFGARSLEFDLIAFWIMEIDRRSIAFSPISLDCFADRYAERGEPRDDGVTIERLHPEAEVIHVGGTFGPRRVDQIEQGRPGPHLHQLELFQPPLDGKSQRLLVESHHRREIAHAQHDMVDSFDTESHGD